MFAVNIHVPLLLGPFGSWPYYQILGNGEWEGKYYSDVYTFPTDMGYTVVVRGNSGNLNLFVTVVISPPSKGMKSEKDLPKSPPTSEFQDVKRERKV